MLHCPQRVQRDNLSPTVDCTIENIAVAQAPRSLLQGGHPHFSADQLAERLDTVDFEQPNTPVLHNVDATEHLDVSEIKMALQNQLCQPVRWVETIQKMVSNGVNTVIECGPGKVLSGLIKRIDHSLTILPMFDSTSLEKALSELTG